MSNQQDDLAKPDYSKYDNMTPVVLVRALAALRAQKEAHDEAGKAITAEYDFLRNVKVPKVFEEQGLEIIRVEGVGRCNLTSDLQAAIPADKREEAYQWLRDTGRGDLIQETVNSSTLKAAVKAMIQAGEDVPEFFRVHTFTRASITKG